MSTIAVNKLRSLGETYLDKALDLIFKRPIILRPIDVEKEICKIIDENCKIFSRLVIAPSRLLLRMHPDTWGQYSGLKKKCIEELNKTAREHVEKAFLQTVNNKPIEVHVLEDDSVPVGKVVPHAVFIEDGQSDEAVSVRKISSGS